MMQSLTGKLFAHRQRSLDQDTLEDRTFHMHGHCRHFPRSQNERDAQMPHLHAPAQAKQSPRTRTTEKHTRKNNCGAQSMRRFPTRPRAKALANQQAVVDTWRSEVLQYSTTVDRMVDEMTEQRDAAMARLLDNEAEMSHQRVGLAERNATILELKRGLERLTLEAQALKENARVASIPAKRPERAAVAAPRAPVESPVLDVTGGLRA